MEVNLLLIAVGVFAIFIWIFAGLKNHKRRFFAILIILFLLFAVYGFNATFAGKNLEINSVGDFGNAAQLYLAWFGNAFENIQIITANAVKLDWRGNQTT